MAALLYCLFPLSRRRRMSMSADTLNFFHKNPMSLPFSDFGNKHLFNCFQIPHPIYGIRFQVAALCPFVPCVNGCLLYTSSRTPSGDIGCILFPAPPEKYPSHHSPKSAPFCKAYAERYLPGAQMTPHTAPCVLSQDHPHPALHPPCSVLKKPT